MHRPKHSNDSIRWHARINKRVAERATFPAGRVSSGPPNARVKRTSANSESFSQIETNTSVGTVHESPTIWSFRQCLNATDGRAIRLTRHPTRSRRRQIEHAQSTHAGKQRKGCQNDRETGRRCHYGMDDRRGLGCSIRGRVPRAATETRKRKRKSLTLRRTTL